MRSNKLNAIALKRILFQLNIRDYRNGRLDSFVDKGYFLRFLLKEVLVW